MYSNVNGSTPCPSSSSTSTPVVLDQLSEGLLASAVTLETGVGGPACPWIIRVQPHQRINITLLDFSVASSPFDADGAPAARRGQQYRPSSGRATAAAADAWDGPMSMPSWLGAPCHEYAVLTEGGSSVDGSWSTAGRNATVCGRRRRQSPVYLSDTNVVQVRIDVAASRSHRFVLKYQGVGLSNSSVCTFFVSVMSDVVLFGIYWASRLSVGLPICLVSTVLSIARYSAKTKKNGINYFNLIKMNTIGV